MPGEPPATKRGSGRAVLFLGAGLVVLAGLAGAWLAGWFGGSTPRPSDHPTTQGEPPDPRRAYAGPYRNIDPDVRYVGDAQCVRCHEDVAESYAHHPMGRSMVPAADLLDRQGDVPDTNNPFTALGRRFQVVRQGERVWHRQAVLDDAGKPGIELSQEVRWVIGSGTKGYSYLSERDGYLFQTPISWYTQKQRWDLSPSFVPSALAGRIVSASCLFCHTNRVRQDSEHPDHFAAPVFEGHAIGCERCHGPGELHVRKAGDHTIVNPARLPPPLRDAVCEQCHLEGEARILRSGRGLFDYRPGLPLADFWAVLVRARQSGEDAKAVNHVEQMYQSKCFQRPLTPAPGEKGEGKGGGTLKLGCISCHNPHVRVGAQEREAHYRAMCLKCHDEAKGQPGCSEPLPKRQQTTPRDSCIECHMPRYTSSDIAHTASTDHRIVRRPADKPVGAAMVAGHEDDLDRAVFVDFYQDRHPGGDPQAERTLGLGLVKMMNAGMLAPQRHGERALGLLESALGLHPQDAELRAGKTQALLLLGRNADALVEARSALAKRPGDWRLLAWAAGAAQAEGQTDLALGYWRRTVQINPFVPDYQVSLLVLLLRTGELEEARACCEKLLKLDPFNVSGRQAWVGFLLQQGKKAEARDEFDVIRRLRPPDLAKREEWFQQQLK
jgi:predicted CXXCH cytochrome family protein